MADRPIDRVVAENPELLDALVDLSGADLSTLLLEVMRTRSATVDPAQVRRQYSDDRFVASSRLELRDLHRIEGHLLKALPDTFDGVVLSPLAPTGVHSTVAGVHQNNVVSTVRRTDVAADPTTGLALEAVNRRGALLDAEPKSAESVRLAGLQRVVRAQRFDGPLSFSHFTLLGLVSAGRDTGSAAFERTSVVEHATYMAQALAALDADEVVLTITDWTGVLDGCSDAVAEVVPSNVTVIADPDRTRAKGYYAGGAIEAAVRFGDVEMSAGDGGLVDWSQQLLGNAKERMMISGIGVDRLVMGTD